MGLCVNLLREGIDHIKNPLRRVFIAELLNRVKEEYGDRLISFVVFGSVARGEDSPLSDLDLFLILDTDECFFDRTYRLAKLLNNVRRSRIAKILEEKGCSLSTEIYPLNIAEASGFRPIYLDMCLDVVVIYDKNFFFRNIMTKLRSALNRLGSKRVNLPNGDWIWILKPELKFGEEFRIGI